MKTTNEIKHEVKIYNTLEETINNDWIIQSLKQQFSFGRRGLTYNQHNACWEAYNTRMEQINNTFNNK